MQYVDITNQYKEQRQYQIKKQKYFISDDGIEYKVDGKYVILKPTQREIEVARLLGERIGGKVNVIPRISKPTGIKTPDYIINSEKFDLKKKKQANNFIIDLTNAKIDLKETRRQIESIYISKRFLWIDKLFVIKENEILQVYKRK